MIRSFFKVAVRNLWKHKGYSLLNIAGLAIGLTCSLLIFLWVQHERSVDGFHKNGAQIYSVYERQFFDGKVSAGYYTPGLLAEEMKKVIPEVQLAAGFTWTNEGTFEVGNKILKKEGRFAGVDYFKIFSYPLLQGDAATALAEPHNIALDESMAKAFFGTAAAAMGKTIRFDNKKDFIVTAVFKDLPENASQQFEYLLPWEVFLEEESWAKEWGNNGPETIVLLRKDADGVAVDKKIRRFLDTYNKEQGEGFRIELNLQPYTERYLHSNFKDGHLTGGRIEYVRLFSIIAVFILLIACINFMNLTTARSAKRAREIGVRKVIGAVRPMLIAQFMGEAVLLSFLAIFLALLLLLALLPAFGIITGKQISYPFGQGTFWVLLLVLTLVTGLLSGSYPALLLSSFKPIRVLKGSMKFSGGAAWFRKGLVIFQFTLSTVLIIGTIVVARQVNYLQSVNLGYDKENLLYVSLEGDLTGKYPVLKEELLRIPGITAVSRVSQGPVEIDNSTGGVDWDGKEPNTFPQFTQVAVGYDYCQTMHLQLLQGRDFSREFATDSVNYIVNEAALKKIGYKDPIGRRLAFWGKEGKIIGVLKDFHFTSLHTPIQPIILRLMETGGWGAALVRTQPGKTKAVLKSMEQLCRRLNPRFPFTPYFVDEQYQNMYSSEQVVGKLSDWFAFLAIFISCLGLLGLAMFTAEQRTKEFGVRKVLGASIASLFALLSKDFLILVLIAFLIASPLAWWAMQNWLENFAYHVAIDWWIFLVAGILALLIALLTISFQAMRAAMTNPVLSLRSE